MLISDITQIKGIGEKTAALFHRLFLYNTRDVLYYFPRDYETFLAPVSIEEARIGDICAVFGTVTAAPAARKIRNMVITNLKITDGRALMRLTFFNMPYLTKSLKVGTGHVFRGRVQKRGDELFMEQARIYKTAEYEALTGFLQPRYPLTAGLSNNMMTKAVKQVLAGWTFGADHLPESLRRRYDLLPLRQAVADIHFPDDLTALALARRRLVFDEFFLFIIMVRQMRRANAAITSKAVMLEVAETERLLEALPYRLTTAQLRVWAEIKNDLSGQYAMNRLIQGDVGSGKTILAFLSLLMCVANGYQGAMMAPTEILAEQHFAALKELSGRYRLPFRAALLTGSLKAADKRMIYEQLARGEVNVVIGTHALIQEKLSFSNLALVITDEQHRFGVRQREGLAGKGLDVHVLVMSATPIPRTLAIIIYGDLHLSVLDELPAGRRPIKNCVVNTAYRETAYRFIAGEIAKGRQVYVICPLVEAGELDGVENATDYTVKLRHVLPEHIRIAALHGKMKPAEKHRIMEGFSAHNIDVIVATTVIEVGINVPNATVMMVENAERFGLAQLHQLRGRVGRGEAQSYCILVSGSQQEATMKRLGILNRSNDGFFIAGEDLRLRGPGDLFGIRQSGLLDFKLGDIYQDADVLKTAAEAAETVLADEGGLPAELREYIADGVMKLVDFRSI